MLLRISQSSSKSKCQSESCESMEKQNLKNRNRIWFLISLFTTLGYFFLLSLRHDFWYDLNDDVMIKNITSGIYTGRPESHNIQMQYPLSLVISLLYSLAGQIPWYALFLVVTQVLSIFLILKRTSEMFSDIKNRTAIFIATSAILFWLLTKHMVIYQYTVSCAFLSGAATFLLMTDCPVDGEDGKVNLRFVTGNHIAIVILLLLSFLIRSEMMLLTFPMVMVSFLFRFIYTCSADIGILKKQHIFGVLKKYLLFFITAIVLLIVAALLNSAGYASAGWKNFTAFFDARTELYDFNTLPSYEDHESFYQSIGLDQSSQKLLDNYNYGLDEQMDAQTLEGIAAYSKEQSQTEKGTAFFRFKSAFLDYLRRVARPFCPDEDETDVFWKMTVTVIYLLALLVGFKHHILWKLLLLAACRTTLWMYILYRNRVPIRITHSLYFVELMVLMGLLFLEIQRAFEANPLKINSSKNKKIITIVISIATVIVFVTSLPWLDNQCMEEEKIRQRQSEPYDILFAYMEKNTDQFYLMDVYSWVPYTEKLFTSQYFNNDKNLKAQSNGGMNYDLLGGWATFSPIADQKIEALGASSIQEALMKENVYFVQRAGTDLSWLENYYQDSGYDIVIEHAETVGEFDVYRITKKQTNPDTF